MSAVVRAVLDTDTYNEIDDQFAVVYALLSPERIRLEAIYAAPFHNGRSTGPGDGMLKSHAEIRRLLDRMPGHADVPVHQGSTSWLPASPSAASQDLIARAYLSEEPLYVLAIGAPTNVAAALKAEPGIAERIVVVWLGGNPRYWHRAVEFNVEQDPAASHVLLDSGVPLVHVPCRNVTEHLRTTQAEIERHVRGAGAIGDYLADIYAGWYPEHFGRSKVLWDLGAVAWLVNPAWVPTAQVHSPLLTAEGTWSHDPRRHLIREALWVDRDAVFRDLFTKLRRRPPR
ncbi:nucleoside hydrolase [Actinoplanes sp. NBRC 103695]|uniref:nucleoside hydrolase n=1 Tax=Actinoplanes sp. NBRC 103695 TaxID=3032202 RepID=UPI002556BDCE|nr:nucleoside hydrolase [Actinoplanes sp. NBRC 103695]